jgi:hypothetical protein
VVRYTFKLKVTRINKKRTAFECSSRMPGDMDGGLSAAWAVFVPAAWAVFVPVLCVYSVVLTCKVCVDRWFAEREESVEVEEEETAAHRAEELSSPSARLNATAKSRPTEQVRGESLAHRPKAPRSTTKAGPSRQASDDRNTRMPSARNSPSAASILRHVDTLPVLRKPTLHHRPSSPSSSCAMGVRTADTRKPSNVRFASARDCNTSRVEHSSLRSYVCEQMPEEERPSFTHRNEHTPKPRGMPAKARLRQEKRQPAGYGATAACDAAGSSLLHAALQDYYASAEALPQGARSIRCESSRLADPAQDRTNGCRNQDAGAFETRRPSVPLRDAGVTSGSRLYGNGIKQAARPLAPRDIHGGKLHSTT